MRRSQLSCLVFVSSLLVGCGSDSEELASDAGPDLEPACAREDCQCTSEADCLAHAECDVAQGECVCVVGYDKVGQFCVFGGLADPDLDGTPAAWQVVGNVTIDDADGEGLADPGTALWDRTAINELDYFWQQISMPPLGEAEPFVAVVRQEMTALSPALVYQWFAPSAMVRVGNQTSRLPVTGFGWGRYRVCLGESAYGGDVEVRVSPSNPERALSGYTLEIDSVQIEPAMQGECPVVGEAIDGDFEGGRWIARGGGDVRDEIGVGGSSAGHLEAANCGGLASVSTTVSIPQKDVGQALQFTWRASDNAVAEVGLGLPEFSAYFVQTNLREVSPFTGVSGPQPTLQRTEACIPPHMMGSVANLTFALQKESFGTDCSNTLRTFDVDEVSIIEAPACPTAGALADPSFELVQNAVSSGWGLSNDAGRTSLPLLVGGTEAVDGTHVLRLTSSPENATCQMIRAVSSFRYPEVGAGELPAVRVRYRYGSTVSTMAELEISRPRDVWNSRSVPTFPADDGGGQVVQGWQTATACALPHDAGRTDDLVLTFRPNECDAILDQYLELDLVEVLAVPVSECGP